MKKVKLSKAGAFIGLVLINAFFAQACRKEIANPSLPKEEVKVQKQQAVNLENDLSVYDCEL